MEVKQVIVIRKDLNMRKGKMIAQGCHASMKVLLDRMYLSEEGISYKTDILPEPMIKWMEGSFTKIVVGCNSKGELMELKAEADGLGIPNALMVDNGWTEFHNTTTITCLAIGPDNSDMIDKITGELQLI